MEKEEKSNKTSPRQNIPWEVEKQLSSIDQSLAFIQQIIAAIILNYRALACQRQQILDAACNGGTPVGDDSSIYPMRFAANAVILRASAFFFSLAKQALQTPQQDCALQQSAQTNFLASLLVLLAAAIRFYDLNAVEQNSSPAETAEIVEGNPAI